MGDHRTTHEIDVDAPADVVYGIIADATTWPLYFAPSVHVERTALGDSAERLRIWADANGEVKNWTSRRDLDAQTRRITFRQEVSSPPVASMGGEWIVTTGAGGGARLRLSHEFDAVDQDPESIAWITRATDRNSEKELANVKAVAERWDRLGELVFSFEDAMTVDGPAQAVYDFLYQAKLWPDRLPHVSRLELREDLANVQVMSMDTRTADGSAHTTESVRICFPCERIVYKQMVTPSLMTAHTGEWIVEPAGDRVQARSRHTVALNEDNIGDVLGADATVEAARAFVRKAAGGNSVATLTLAKEFVEARHA
jgi:Polyketide cyclase / dehydrase and lipid transport